MTSFDEIKKSAFQDELKKLAALPGGVPWVKKFVPNATRVGQDVRGLMSKLKPNAMTDPRLPGASYLNVLQKNRATAAAMAPKPLRTGISFAR